MHPNACNHMFPHTHTRAHTRARAHTHTRSYTHIHTRAPSYTHTLIHRFLRLLCTELQRINSFIGRLARDKFVRMDNLKTGQVRQLPGAGERASCRSARERAHRFLDGTFRCC